MEVTLKNIVNRIELETKLLSQHPEDKEMLERHIRENKELIVQCVLQNKDNPLLNQIRV